MNIASASNLTIPREKAQGMKVISALTMMISVFALIIGGLSLSLNSLEAYPVPLLFILFVGLLSLFFFARLYRWETKRSVLVFALLALVSSIIIRIIPEYLQGFNINGVIHRSLISALLLMSIAVPATCYSLYYFLGATPRAYDISRYPLLFFPIVLGLSAYALIIFRIIVDGAPQLNWSLLVHPFISQYSNSEVWSDGWPTFVATPVSQVGMLNHILGTLVLMGLTSAISLPIGVGVGIFIHQYAGKKLAGIINFSTTALRSISGIILAVTVFNLVRSVDYGTIWGYILHGFGYNVDGILTEGRSSYLITSIFISLLVIPLIAKATEEGLRSLPQDIFEGSLAVGASKEHTLVHILLPWSLPNIITGLVLGCAEAAGALTIIFLISGTGEYGVGPLNETTSLGYLIFDCRYGRILGDSGVEIMMGGYRYTAAFLLLIMTVGLTIAALILKNRFSRRYKGA